MTSHTLLPCRIFSALLIGSVWLAANAAPQDPPSPDIFELRELLTNREYQQLHQKLDVYEHHYENGSGSEISVEIAYSAFAGGDPAYVSHLDEWTKTFPDHYSAHMARAVYWKSLGWIRRGEEYSSATSKEQFAGMREAHKLALAEASQVLKMKPAMTLAYSSLVSLASSRNAREAYERGLEVNPTSYLLRKAMLSNLAPRWGGSYEAIEKLLEETRPYTSENEELIPLMGYLDYTKALDKISAGAVVESLAYSTAAIEHGEKAYYYQRRADAHYRLDDFDTAVIDYSRAISLYPYSADAYLYRGLAYKELGEFELSLQDLTDAARLRPYDYNVRLGLGNALLKEERFEEAIDSYYAAMEYRQDDHSLWYYTGWYLSNRLKRYEEALESLNKATALEPNKPSYWYETAVALNALKDCTVTTAMEKYLKLCAARSDCATEKVQWVTQTSAYLKSSFCKP